MEKNERKTLKGDKEEIEKKIEKKEKKEDK